MDKAADKAPSPDRDQQKNTAEYFLQNLAEVGRLLEQTYDRRSGLGRNHSRIIGVLLARDGQTQTEIANELHIHKVSAGIYIAELEAMNLVERRPHSTDGRAKCIYFSDYFHQMRHIGAGIFDYIFARSLQGISDEQYRMMIECIEIMRKNLEELDADDRQSGV